MTEETFDEYKARNPHLSEFWPFLDQLHKESPRGKVLISCSFLDEQLRRVLIAFFIDEARHAKLVDGSNSPLGSFSARISACHALGLISDNERHDLDVLRRIRNDFAHDLHTSFSSQSVVDRCATLRLKAHDYTSEKMGEVVVPPIGQFDTAATSLIMNLINRPHYVSQERRVQKGWPY